MNVSLLENTDACYQLAEQKAANYLTSLERQVKQKDYIATLTKDIHSWKQNHIHSPLSLFSRKERKPDSRGYHYYIRWLDRTGKLEHYLDRSVSYIFMRDLGKDLNSFDTQAKVQRVVTSLKNQLTQGEHTNMFSLASLYRMAQKEGIESTFIWVMEKLKKVSSNIPEGIDAVHAQRKLIKIIAGVLMNVLEEMGDEVPSEIRTQKLAEAIRLGYSYGLTYPFIDDLLDSGILTNKEKKRFSDLIRTTLITGTVPKLGEWSGETRNLIQYIHAELKEAFEYIKARQQTEMRTSFFEQSYLFFQSQEVDRDKDLSNENYTNQELYIPIILKSSSSRSIIRSLISAPEDKGYENRTFFYGIYNQLADDFADMFDDMMAGAVTPYTYYMKYHDKRPDLLNPYELYWVVISNLIHNVYQSDTKTCEIILNRAINGLKRFKEKMGTNKYNEVMNLFASYDPKFNHIIQKMVQKAGDVDFFDKLLRDHIITILKNEQEQKEDFLETIGTVRHQINNLLPICQIERFPLKESLLDAANYSLQGDGKRLRPIMTWLMGVNEYRLEGSALIPLLKSLEYMHTASLIFDDLPSQDNASIRRGRLTLHEVYNVAIAELTGIFLTQKATQEQASLEQFDPKTVLSLIQYSAQVAADMCRGQAIDLDSKGKQLTLEQLNIMCFYKTGLAFEASLIMPAILAQVQELEMGALKRFAYHAGIAFQIKDDLLDVEGEQNILGKPVGQDIVNNHSTFVSVLGSVGAKKAMWEHYCLATDALHELEHGATFLKALLNYMVNRDH